MKTTKLIQFCDAPGIELLVDSHHGIYVPKFFIDSYGQYLPDLTEEQKTDLSSPENEFYWDSWDDVLNMELTNDAGKIFILSQHDGDLWAVPSYIADSIDWDSM